MQKIAHQFTLLKVIWSNIFIAFGVPQGNTFGPLLFAIRRRFTASLKFWREIIVALIAQ